MNFDYHLMRFDWTGGPTGIGPGVARLARTLESAGVRTLSVMDHFFQNEAYAPIEDPLPEGYTTLAYVAGLTERLRLRLLVGGVAYRRPGVLVKTVTTLDVLSGGRAELALGAGWYEREHRGLGVPFPSLAERFEMLEETLQLALQMWSDNNGPYEGRHFHLTETLCSPRPVSQPHPPILVGGEGEKKTLRLVAQYADACNFMLKPRECAHKIAVLREHCDRLGRDIREIEVTALLDPRPHWTPDRVVSLAEEYAALGVSSIIGGWTPDFVAKANPPGLAGADPIAQVESLYGPVLDQVRAIEPAPL